MVQRAATHIARKAVEMDIVPGRSPISVAAAAIYMASQVREFVKFFFHKSLTNENWMLHRHRNISEVKRKLVTLLVWLMLQFVSRIN